MIPVKVADRRFTPSQSLSRTQPGVRNTKTELMFASTYYTSFDSTSVDILERPMFKIFPRSPEPSWLHCIGLNLVLGATMQDRCDHRVHLWSWRACGVSACGQMRVMPLTDLLPVYASLLAHPNEHAKCLSYLHASFRSPQEGQSLIVSEVMVTVR